MDTRHFAYYWTPESSVSIEEFIKKGRPSIVTNDMADWIWVRGTPGDKKDPEEDVNQGAVLEEAERSLIDLERRLDMIEKDGNIPIRAKKGVKGKKAMRDEAYDETTKKLKELSIRSKWTAGKWLLFPKHEDVDAVFATIGISVAKGPLREAGVMLTKVAPSPLSFDGQPGPHLICLYIENVYDLAVVKKVLEVLLTQHGLEPSAVKSDLYTVAGIDSNHPTKLRSSIWRPNEVITSQDTIKELKAQFNQSKGKTSNKADNGIIESDSEDEKISRVNKRKSPPAGVAEGKGNEEETKTEKGQAAKVVSAKPKKRVKSAA
ncbi:hypothetical protein P7C73_g1295, partial [Tremellales sp. Uapishka_1]